MVAIAGNGHISFQFSKTLNGLGLPPSCAQSKSKALPYWWLYWWTLTLVHHFPKLQTSRIPLELIINPNPKFIPIQDFIVPLRGIEDLQCEFPSRMNLSKWKLLCNRRVGLDSLWGKKIKLYKMDGAITNISRKVLFALKAMCFWIERQLKELKWFYRHEGFYLHGFYAWR